MAIYFDFVPGFAMPPYWLQNKEVATAIDSSKFKSELIGVPHFDTVRVRIPGNDWWTLPIDPVVSVSGKNNIIKRSVLKIDNTKERRGTIKELWSQDDYEVNIAGVFLAENDFPETEIRNFRQLCEHRGTVEIESKLLTLFNITKIAIEDFSLPFTRGIENQMWNIKAYSDDVFELLIEEETK